MRRLADRVALFIIVWWGLIGPAAAFDAHYDREPYNNFPVTWPVSLNEPTVSYQLNDAGTLDVPLDRVQLAVEQSMQTWSNVSSAFLLFQLQGTTPLRGLEPAQGCEEEGCPPDGVNVIAWWETGWEEEGFPPDMVAVNFLTIDHAGGETGSATIIDSDILFNDAAFVFADNEAPDAIDIQNLLTHELGHSLFLDDLTDADDADKTMFNAILDGYPSFVDRGVPGEVDKQTLHFDDKNGISRLYPIDDRSEPNQSQTTGALLVTEDAVYDELNVLNDDWYLINLAQGESLTVRIDFTHDYGDLQLSLYDPDKKFISPGSWTDNDAEEKTLSEVELPGLYGIKVFPSGSSANNNSYMMTIDVTTTQPANQAPSAPDVPQPQDQQTNVPVADVTLSWQPSEDPERDEVTYTLFFEAGNPDPQVQLNGTLTEPAYDLDPLASGTTYYWKVIARDEHGLETSGLIWSFTTEGLDLANIAQPAFGISVSPLDNPSLTIAGTATAVGFQFYALSYGVGSGPAEWTPIGEAVTTPVVDGVLGTWEIGDLSYGLYTLRLVVTGLDDLTIQDVTEVILEPYVPRQITDDSGKEFGPAISGTRIVWEEDSDIDLYDLLTNIERPIATGPSSQGSPDISGHRIVWQENGQLYLSDLTTDTTRQLTSDPAQPYNPRISGDRVIWEDARHGQTEIYLYDLATNTEQRITTGGVEIWWGSLDISGDRIVWTALSSDRYYMNLYLYDLATGTQRQLTTGFGLFPKIDGDRIVWVEHFRAEGVDIYLYDLATDTERRISTDPISEGAPDISGDRVVWADYRNGDSDIFVYDLTTDTEQRMTLSPAGQGSPAIDGDRLVWIDNRTGRDDIFLYEFPPLPGSDNQPPEIPSKPKPGDGDPDQKITVQLNWQGGDPDPGDQVTYDLYLDTQSPPVARVAEELPQSKYDPDPPLEYDTTYYWQVFAKDEAGLITPGPIWSFTTEAPPPPNQPPAIPNEPQPIHEATDVPFEEVTLSWSGGDPDGDEVTYEVRLDLFSPPTTPVPTDDPEATSITVGPLAESTTYFWQVIASDGQVSVEGPIWQFMTVAETPPQSDISPPEMFDEMPTGDEISRDTNITFRLRDPSGIDHASLNVEVNDNAVIEDGQGVSEAYSVQIVATSVTESFVLIDPTEDFKREQTVAVDVSVKDLAPEPNEKIASFSFTTQMLRFGQNLQINSPRAPDSRYRPVMAVSSDGDAFIAWDEFDASTNQSELFLARSFDGGRSFTEHKPNIPEIGSSGICPQLAQHGDRLYLTWIQSGPPPVFENTLRFAFSDDQGVNFSPPLALNGAEQPTCRIAVDARDNRVAVAWVSESRLDEPSQMFVMHSTDRGESFDEPLDVDDGAAVKTSTSIQLGPGQETFLVWSAIIDNVSHVFADVSERDGFGRDIQLDQGEVGAKNPHFRAHQNGQRFHVTWESGDDIEVLTFKDFDELREAVPMPVPVIDDTGQAAQSHPSVAVAPSSEVAVAWIDLRNEQNGNGDSDIYAAESIDRGVNFNTNEPVNDDTGSQPQGGLGFDSPPAIAMDNEGAIYLAWIDQRNSRLDVFFAKTPVMEELKTETVPAEGGTITTPDGISVEVSDEAFDAALTITISEPEGIPQTGLPSGVSPVGRTIDFGPSGTVFDEPVTICLPYDPADVAQRGLDVSTMKVYQLNEDQWSVGIADWNELTQVAATASNVACAETSHFSTHQLGGGPKGENNTNNTEGRDTTSGDSSSGSGGGGGGGCAISTVAFGGRHAPEVQTFEAFRDQVALKHALGRAWIRFYEQHAPAIAKALEPHPALKALVRVSLRPVLWVCEVWLKKKDYGDL